VSAVIARHWSVLARGWAASALVALAVRGFVWFLPLAADMLRPAYLLALLPGLWGTWRWLRPRRTPDRRGDDRRRAARRGD
jgi:hypothetical protein